MKLFIAENDITETPKSIIIWPTDKKDFFGKKTELTADLIRKFGASQKYHFAMNIAEAALPDSEHDIPLYISSRGLVQALEDPKTYSILFYSDSKDFGYGTMIELTPKLAGGMPWGITFRFSICGCWFDDKPSKAYKPSEDLTSVKPAQSKTRLDMPSFEYKTRMDMTSFGYKSLFPDYVWLDAKTGGICDPIMAKSHGHIALQRLYDHIMKSEIPAEKGLKEAEDMTKQRFTTQTVGLNYSYPTSEKVRQQTNCIVVLPEDIIWEKNPLFDQVRVRDGEDHEKLSAHFRKACNSFKITDEHILHFDTLCVNTERGTYFYGVFYIDSKDSELYRLRFHKASDYRYRALEEYGRWSMLEGMIRYSAEEHFPNLNSENKSNEDEDDDLGDLEDHPF